MNERVDIVEFRTAIQTIRETRGWTWQQIADMIGYPMGRLSNMMFDKRLRTVSKETATFVLQQLLRNK